MKKYWPIVAVGLLVLGGCGVTTPTAKVVPTEIPSKAETLSTRAALKDLLAGGKEEKCTWTAEENGNNMSGTLYISGKKFRQEEAITDLKTKAVSQLYSLSDGESVYAWGSAMMGGKGFKTSFTELQALVTGIPTGTQTKSGIDLNKEYLYKCEPWTASADLLTPPKEVTFQDMSETLKQMQELQKKFGGKINIPSSEAGNSGENQTGGQ
jgi:hypothetical protein